MHYCTCSAVVGCWVQSPVLLLQLLAWGLMNPDSILGYGLAAKFGTIHFPWGHRFTSPARLPLVMLLLSANLVSYSRCWQSHFGEGVSGSQCVYWGFWCCIIYLIVLWILTWVSKHASAPALGTQWDKRWRSRLIAPSRQCYRQTALLVHIAGAGVSPRGGESCSPQSCSQCRASPKTPQCPKFTLSPKHC